MFVNKVNRCLKLPQNLRFEAVRSLSAPEPSAHSTVDDQDVAHLSKMASTWWDPDGPMLPLHSLNTVRIPFIRDGLLAVKPIPAEKIRTTRVLEGFKILDIGCGAGVLAEPLARLHADVVGIDAGKDVIEAAERHVCASSPELLDRIKYKVDTVENHAKEYRDYYDAVVMSEVVEHVANVPMFVAAAVDTIKPGGSIFITTLNRTIANAIFSIYFAENILKLIPKGTHDYDKFVRPIEMQRMLESLNCSTIMLNGLIYEFWRNTWKWIPTTQFSYALHAVKRKEECNNQNKAK